MLGTSKKTILVVDDDLLTLSLLSAILRPKGFEVAMAQSGDIAVETAKRRRPDLVLLDIAMPRSDGYAVVRQLRALLGRNIPILALTGRLEKDADRAARAYFTGWITKPFDTSNLVKIVAEQLSTTSDRGIASRLN